ncbi:MAG: VCBS repeat-containing protein [Candidatus Aenigmarchaeota archaeon]|nr:VCBS repeat-containing protein [Candidatus Aenigmarchaeota archaeon]
MTSAKLLTPVMLLAMLAFTPYAAALSVNLTMPADGYASPSGNITFGCNATDENLTNITLYVWDSDNATYYTNTTNVTGTFNETNWTVNDTPPGNYHWNCMAYDNESNSAWAAANMSVHSNLFYLYESSSEGDNTYKSVAFADIDNDGDLDYIAGNSGSGEPNRVYKNDGSGHFTLYESSAESDITFTIAIADLDNDGDPDYIAGNNFNEPNRVYLNNGTGNFTLHETNTQTNGEDTQAVAIADIDNDGDLDYAVANTGGGAELQIYKNDGSAHFTIYQNITASNFYTLVFGDINDDNYPDIIAGGIPTQDTKIYLNNGSGHFNYDSFLPDSSSKYTYSLALGDIDNDGDEDIVEGNRDDVRIFLNNGDISFTLLQTITSTETQSITLGDLNDDGYVDFIEGNDNNPNYIYLNNGSGYFSAFESDSSSRTFSVALGDIDNDGNLDYAAGNFGSPNYVYKNRLDDSNYVNVYVKGTSSIVNRDAVGTKIIASDTNGNILGFREVTASGITHGRSNQLHFGLAAGKSYILNASFITGKVVSCTVQAPKSFIMYENGSSTDGVSCYVVDFDPEIEAMTPESGNVTKSSDVNFTCNVSDDNMLTSAQLYLWNSTNDLYTHLSSSISGTTNSSSWFVQDMVPDTYKWNCIVCDNASQCTGQTSNYSLTVLKHNRLHIKLVINNTENNVYIPGQGIKKSSNVNYHSSDPPYFYLASYLNNVVYALVFENRMPGIIEAENDANTHSISIEGDLDGSRMLLAFTEGGWRTIQDRMSLIQSNVFLTHILPSFSLGLGRNYETVVALFYNNIDIRGRLKIENGQHQITLENNASGTNMIIDINQLYKNQ